MPFVARWGDGTAAGSMIEPGSVSHQIICNHDWVASMYALTETPMADLDAMDAVNILPILLGTQPENEPVRDFMILQAILGHAQISSTSIYTQPSEEEKANALEKASDEL